MRRLVARVEEQVAPYLAGASTGGIVLLSLMAGIGEEALFRGVIQAGLAERVPASAAVVIAALLFGVAHWLTRSYALLAGLIGVYLGVLFLLTDNLLVPRRSRPLRRRGPVRRSLTPGGRASRLGSDGIPPPG